MRKLLPFILPALDVCPLEKQDGTIHAKPCPLWTGKEGTIPQATLPLIPEDTSRVSGRIGVHRDSQWWTYFHGAFPIGRHRADDRRSFQLLTCRLIDVGACRQAEVIRAFGVSKSSVARAQIRRIPGNRESFLTCLRRCLGERASEWSRERVMRELAGDLARVCAVERALVQ